MNTFIQNLLFLLLALACAGAAHFYFSVAQEYAFIPLYFLLIWRVINLVIHKVKENDELQP